MSNNSDEQALAIIQERTQTVGAVLERMTPDFRKVLPKHITPERLMRVAMSAIRDNPDLLKCHASSLYAAIMSAAQLGLVTDGILGEAYMVPFGKKNSQWKICTLIPGYKGYIKLAKQSGLVLDIDCDVVHPDDRFDFERGSTPFIKHRWAETREVMTVKNTAYAWACIRYKSGGFEFEVLTKDDVEMRRKRAPSRNSMPWKEWWSAMAKKTCIRQLAKRMPLSPELRQFHQAVALEDNYEGGVAAKIVAESVVLDVMEPQVTQEEEPQAPSKLDDFAAQGEEVPPMATGDPNWDGEPSEEEKELIAAEEARLAEGQQDLGVDG